MPLKYPFSKLFRGKLVSPQPLYETLEDLDNKIENGADAKPVIKTDVKLTKSALKKAFGKKFNSIGVVHNEDGSYLVIADGDNFKFIAFEDI